jgi:hypothetical protein
MYKPSLDQVESQLAVMSASHVTQKSVIALLPERNDTQLASTEVQNSGLSNPIQPISSSGARRHPPERQRLRVFSLPAPFVRTNSILMASLDQPPVALESNMDKNEVISALSENL